MSKITLLLTLLSRLTALKTEKFYDIFGGLNYLILALLSAILGATGDGVLQWIDDPRKILVTILFGVSRGWLLMFLAWRAHELGLDREYGVFRSFPFCFHEAVQ